MLKRGKQGHRQTMSIAGCLRSYLSRPSVRVSDRVLEVRGGGPEGNPVTQHVKRPLQEGPNKCPDEGEVKEPTRTERPPSALQLQGVIATVSEEDRATATLCLPLDAAEAGCCDYKSGMRQSPGSARRVTISQPSHSSLQASKSGRS